MPPKNREYQSPLYRVLDDTREVTADDALFDLCSLTIGLAEVQGTEEATHRALTALSKMKVEVVGAKSLHLFTERRLERRRQWHSLTVRSANQGEGVKFPHLVFSGLMMLKREGELKNPGRGQFWKPVFNVNVSLLRTLQAQTIDESSSKVSWSKTARPSLVLSAQSARMVEERLLVPTTNILDRTEARQRLAGSKCPEDHLRDFIVELARQCGKAMGSPARFVPTVTLGTLEVSWDFYDEQPIITVELLKERAMRIASHLRARFAPEATLAEGLHLNSPSVILELRKDFCIRFYAKSTQTVRFEVIYGKDRIEAFKPRTGILSLDEAMQAARAIRQDAAAQLNVVLGLMWEDSIGREQDATTDELVRAVSAAFPNITEARFILSALARFRRIRTFPNDPFLPGLRKLKRMNVLENEPKSPGKRNYVVTPRYEAARSTLFFTKAMPRKLWIKPRPRHLRRDEF